MRKLKDYARQALKDGIEAIAGAFRKIPYRRAYDNSSGYGRAIAASDFFSLERRTENRWEIRRNV